MAEDDNNVQYVERRTGWSSFWRWVGTIVVVLLIGMVIIYVANTFLLGQQMNVQSSQGSEPDAKIELNIGGDDSGSDASNAGSSQ